MLQMLGFAEEKLEPLTEGTTRSEFGKEIGSLVAGGSDFGSSTGGGISNDSMDGSRGGELSEASSDATRASSTGGLSALLDRACVGGRVRDLSVYERADAGYGTFAQVVLLRTGPPARSSSPSRWR